MNVLIYLTVNWIVIGVIKMVECRKCRREFINDDLFKELGGYYCFQCFILKHAKSKRESLSFDTQINNEGDLDG